MRAAVRFSSEAPARQQWRGDASAVGRRATDPTMANAKRLLTELDPIGSKCRFRWLITTRRTASCHNLRATTATARWSSPTWANRRQFCRLREFRNLLAVAALYPAAQCEQRCSAEPRPQRSARSTRAGAPGASPPAAFTPPASLPSRGAVRNRRSPCDAGRDHRVLDRLRAPVGELTQRVVVDLRVRKQHRLHFGGRNVLQHADDVARTIGQRGRGTPR